MFGNIIKPNISGRTGSLPTRIQPKRGADITEACRFENNYNLIAFIFQEILVTKRVKTSNERKAEFLQAVHEFLSSKCQGMVTEVFLVQDLHKFLMSWEVSFSLVILLHSFTF